MTKVTLTQSDLENQLKKQVSWLERSAASFDDGYEDEAGRLAVTIRTLVHDTRNSHSLLGMLRRKGIPFFDSSIPPTPGNLNAHGGLIIMTVGDDGKAIFLPPLDDAPMSRGLVSFENWWTAEVFTRPTGSALSRKSLILTAANQDGGAHVDPELDADYRDLQSGNFLGWKTTNPQGSFNIEGAEKAAIRQITHEILRTLNPNMPKKTNDGKGFGFFTTIPVITQVVHQKPGLPLFPDGIDPRKIGRNSPCPCGSGKKYKRCHGAPLQI